MKRSISLLSVLAFLLTFTGNVFAQSQVIQASADIVSGISLQNPTPLQFGQLESTYTPGDPSIVPAADGTFTLNNTGTGAQGGSLQISTNGIAQSLSVTIDSPAALTNGGSSSIDFGINHVVADQGGTNSTNITNDGGSATVTSADDGNGNYYAYVYLGGSLDTSPTESGTHTGNITISVSYN
jgi:hypothetical protein